MLLPLCFNVIIYKNTEVKKMIAKAKIRPIAVSECIIMVTLVLFCIGNFAFGDCNSLKSITIHDGVTYIGSSALFRCAEIF